jgi:hypothetical protein
MIRRQFIKGISSLPLVPLVFKGEEIGKTIQIDPNAKYIVLIKSSCRIATGEGIRDFCDQNTSLPIGTPIFVVDDPEEDIKILKL